MVVVAAVAAIAYCALMSGSKGFCTGGVTAEGSFIDSAGNAIQAAPPCIQLTLRPSGLILVAIMAIVIGTLTVILRRARSRTDAIKYIDRGTAAIGILVIASVVISHVWFWAIPITEWNGAGTFIYPFPFGAVDLVTYPMAP